MTALVTTSFGYLAYAARSLAQLPLSPKQRHSDLLPASLLLDPSKATPPDLRW